MNFNALLSIILNFYLLLAAVAPHIYLNLFLSFKYEKRSDMTIICILHLIICINCMMHPHLLNKQSTFMLHSNYYSLIFASNLEYSLP